MNIALPALVGFLLLLPGFVFRSRFKRAEKTSLDYSPFGQVVTEGVLWACVFHGIWLAIAYFPFGRYLNAPILLKLLSSDAASQARAGEVVGAQFSTIAIYFGTLYAAAYLAPALIRHIITKYQFDRFGHPLSFLLRFHQAPWYYLLTGADFKKNEKPDLIRVSAVVDVAGDAVLYTGILDEFFVDADGKLDRLVLQQVMRRPLSSDKVATTPNAADNSARFYQVDGDYFVLRYSEAITFNVQYIKLASETNAPPGSEDGSHALITGQDDAALTVVETSAAIPR